MSNHRKFIPMTAWPSCDRELWQAATADDGLFSRGAAADWSHGSRTSISASYGRWIGWIAATMPADLDLPIEERVNGARVKLYVEMLQSEVSATTTVAYLKHLNLAIRAMCPESDWSWLKRVNRDLSRLARPASKMDRFIPVERILAAAERLMSRGGEDLAGAIDFRDGLILALLAYRPLRRRNIAAIEIGKNLIRVGETYILRFGKDETKNRRVHSAAVPSALVPRLEQYLDQARPRFPRADSSLALWISRNGRPLTVGGFHAAVVKRTRAELGRAISPHLFRTIAATTVALDRPSEIHIASGLLGHASERSVLDHYLLAHSIEASDALDEVIESLRAEALKRGVRRCVR